MEAKGLEPSNLLTASQALYQLSYAPEVAHMLSRQGEDPSQAARSSQLLPRSSPGDCTRNGTVRRSDGDQGPTKPAPSRGGVS